MGTPGPLGLIVGLVSMPSKATATGKRTIRVADNDKGAAHSEGYHGKGDFMHKTPPDTT